MGARRKFEAPAAHHEQGLLILGVSVSVPGGSDFGVVKDKSDSSEILREESQILLPLQTAYTKNNMAPLEIKFILERGLRAYSTSLNDGTTNKLL